MPLKRGSLIQGELQARPDRDPATAEPAQACALVGWQTLLVADAGNSCCVMQVTVVALVLLTRWTCCGCFLSGILCVPCPDCMRSRRCLRLAFRHSRGSWGESPHVTKQQTEQMDNQTKMQVHRWFDNLPLPKVEPVDQNLLYDNESEDRAFGLDGMRLATLAATRDQETALVRELQEGHKELAKFTAENLSTLNKMVEGLEESLCAVTDNVPEMYEE